MVQLEKSLPVTLDLVIHVLALGALYCRQSQSRLSQHGTFDAGIKLHEAL